MPATHMRVELLTDRKGARRDGWWFTDIRAESAKKGRRLMLFRNSGAIYCSGAPVAEHAAGEGIGLVKETKMPKDVPEAKPAEAGNQIPARPHDSGSQANETVDGLDATAEAFRHAVEDTPGGAGLDDVDNTPVFDRAELAPKI